MVVDAIIPVKGLENIKSRLASILDAEDRRRFSLNMFIDVIKAVKDSRRIEKVFVVTPDPQILALSQTMDVETIEEEGEMGVNAAVARATEYAMTRGATSVIVLPSDIPLLMSEDLDRIILMAAEAPSMVITPSLRFDGTNALLLSPPNAMATCYEGDSYNAHLERAEEMRLRVAVYLSRRVMLDIDTPEDIKELLRVGGNTATFSFLREKTAGKFLKKRLKQLSG